MLPEKVTSFIGKTSEPSILEIEKGAIKKYADAVGDRNLLFWDEEYARNSKYGSIIAPPGFFGWPTQWTEAMPLFSEIRSELLDAIAEAGWGRVLDGGIEFELFQPVRSGDTLVAVTKIASVKGREVKGGMMILSVTETSYTNQNGALVGIASQTIICR